MNNGQPLTPDEMLEKIFTYMSRLVVEKDFYKSLILVTDLGKTLVNAHRASFWYHDEKQQQYWTLAASGTERITVPKGTGIVGASIENKETILINNPYEDSRFNPEVDKQTGYLTKSILCMPVTNSSGDVIGAYQVINKMGEDDSTVFDEQDVQYLALAAAYCGKTLEAQLLKEQNMTDQLTGLKNRRGLYNCYDDIILSLPPEVRSSVIICDIDFFKKVNDTYGHNVGDAVLVHIADLLKNNIEDLGEVFRWGGEEFVILLPDCDLNKAVSIAQDLRCKVQESECQSEDVTVKVTMSFGVTVLDKMQTSTDNIKVADDNLYQAKQQGRNKVVALGNGTVKQLLIIPDINNPMKALSLAEKYSLGFEYDDFFNPSVLSDDQKVQHIIDEYSKHTLPEYCTIHGAFYDIIPTSKDEQIKQISLLRIGQSIECARKMGAKGVVFHTNYNPFLNMPAQVKNWVEQSVAVWSEIIEQNSDICIYLENMFEDTPEVMVELSKELSKYDNYGVCLDYAHAALSKVSPELWAQQLSPYIRHIHINDNDLVSDLHLAWGDGKIDRYEFYRSYSTYMKEATVLIETSSAENTLRSIETLKSDGFI